MTSKLLNHQGHIYNSMNSFLLLVPEIFHFTLLFKLVSHLGLGVFTASSYFAVFENKCTGILHL